MSTIFTDRHVQEAAPPTRQEGMNVGTALLSDSMGSKIAWWRWAWSGSAPWCAYESYLIGADAVRRKPYEVFPGSDDAK
jgi:hypothetical protein